MSRNDYYSPNLEFNDFVLNSYRSDTKINAFIGKPVETLFEKFFSLNLILIIPMVGTETGKNVSPWNRCKILVLPTQESPTIISLKRWS